MSGSKAIQNSSIDLQRHSQESPTYKKLGFHTAYGTEWFEFSPMKMKEYFYELGADWASQTLQDDISFSTVLNMSSLDTDSLDDGVLFETDLAAILDAKAKENARVDMLRRVCGHVYHKAEYETLRNQVNRLVEADLEAANVKYDTESDVLSKSSLMALHWERLNFARSARHLEEEFCIHLYKLVKRQAGTLFTVKLYFSYNTSYEKFLFSLNNETYTERKVEELILDDGPWKYSMLLDGQIEGAWSDMSDEKSFQDLLHKLSMSQGEAAMIHTVEDAIERTYQDNNRKDKKEYNNEETELSQSEYPVLDANGDAFFSNSGFMDYLMEQKE